MVSSKPVAGPAVEDTGHDQNGMSSPRRSRVRLAAGIWAVVIAILSSPYIDSLRQINWLDDSWPAGLLMAAREGVHWGPDFVFTYGPYGVLALDQLYFLREALVALVVALVIHAAFIGLLAARMATLKVPLVAWLVATGVLLLRGPMLSFGYETQFVIALVLWIAVEQKTMRNRSSVVVAVIAAALAALLCVWKPPDGVAALGMIAVASGVAAARGRANLAAVMAGVLVIVYGLLWMLAGQALGTLPAYFRGVYEISSGHGPALGINNFSLDPAIGAGLAALIGVLTWWAWRRKDEARILLLLTLPILLVSFRVNLTRADIEHEVIYLYVVILVVLLAALFLRRPSMTARLLLVALVPVSLLGISGSPLSHLSAMEQRIGTYRALYALSRGEEAPLREAARRHYALSDDQLAVLKSGSVDVMPWDLLLPYGYELAWRPRPVPQSYTSFTTYLDRLDAAHFQSIGPEHVLYRYDTVDNRYAPFDEPAVLQALLMGYQVDPSSDSRYMVLDRLPVAMEPVRRDLGRVCSVMGEPIAVPRLQGSPVFAAVHLSYSSAGQLLKAIYVPPPLFIAIAHSGGRSAGPFRFVLGTAEDGLLMSSYVADGADMEALFRGLPDKPIDSFTITTNGSIAYEAPICADFYSLAGT
jgi:hypothetical protein